MNMNIQCPLWLQNLGWVCLAIFMIVLVLLAVAFVGFLVCGIIGTILDEREIYERRKERERR